MTGPLRALGIALLCALGAGPAAADEHQMRWPWPGEWIGHTGPRLGVVVQSMSPELRSNRAPPCGSEKPMESPSRSPTT